MDGDIFGSVSRLGRDAADAVWRALEGGAWDPFCAMRCLDVLIDTAEGVPSLPGVLCELRHLNASPLFARILGEDVSERIATAVANSNGGILDLILKSVTQRCVLRGEHNEQKILTQFFADLLDKTIISGRGGFREHHGSERLSEAHALLLPLAVAAAEVLQRRPDAQRLGLARRHADITPETDLLGGNQ